MRKDVGRARAPRGGGGVTCSGRNQEGLWRLCETPVSNITASWHRFSAKTEGKEEGVWGEEKGVDQEAVGL
jgi:hypothetical protein